MRLLPLHLLLVVGAYCSSACFAGGEDDALSRFKAIQIGVAQAESEFRQVQAKDPGTTLTPEGERLYAIFRRKEAEGEAAIIRIAKDDPQSEAAYLACQWFLMQPDTYSDNEGAAALHLMAIHHATDARLGRAIAMVSHYPPRFEVEKGYAPAVQLLHAVADKNPDRTIRGQAALGLAWLAKWKFGLAEVRNLPDQDKLATHAETAYESLIRDYGDCPNLYERDGYHPTKTLAEQAKRELFELQHLRVGKPAPDIAGEELFGEKFKLSGYRGKVVLLVFWSSWCGPCMAAVPEEKQLVEHLGSRPFVIIGVNGDNDRAVGGKTVASNGMTWRSFWNGGPDGPITRDWNVSGWPTSYIIDAKGIIRGRDLRGAKLTELVELLLHEAELPGQQREHHRT